MSFKNVNELRVSTPSHPTLSVLSLNSQSSYSLRLTYFWMQKGCAEKYKQCRVRKINVSGAANLEKLEIDYIEERTCIWQGVRRLAEDINTLKRPIAGGFPKLESLVAEEERDQRQLELSCRLEYLMLRDTQCLVKLPLALPSLSSSRQIWNCGSPVSSPEAALPSRLRVISFSKCDALESLPDAWMHDTDSCLEKLDIVVP